MKDLTFKCIFINDAFLSHLQFTFILMLKFKTLVLFVIGYYNFYITSTFYHTLKHFKRLVYPYPCLFSINLKCCYNFSVISPCYKFVPWNVYFLNQERLMNLYYIENRTGPDATSNFIIILSMAKSQIYKKHSQAQLPIHTLFLVQFSIISERMR